jgi:hypothetical protein
VTVQIGRKVAAGMQCRARMESKESIEAELMTVAAGWEMERRNEAVARKGAACKTGGTVV